MKKNWIVTLALALAMLLMMTQVAGAVTLDPKTTKMSNVKFHEDGKSIQSIDVQYVWPKNQGLAAADMYVAVLDKDIGNGNDLYDDYFGLWSTLDKAIAGVKAQKGAGCVAFSTNRIHSNTGDTIKTTFLMSKDVIPLAKDKEYFVYIFTQWSGYVYPDARIGVLGVKNGAVTFKAEGAAQAELVTPKSTTQTSEPAPAPTPVGNEVKQAAASMPKTGDESLPIFYAALAISCCAGLMMLKRKKA